jgi:ABC-type glycerol-3-phosphate transport system substrate-binding protein
MKNLKNLALVFAAALITFGASAQQATPTSTSQPKSNTTTNGGTQTQTTTPVRKEKTKEKEKPNGTVKTVTKSKPTKQQDVSTTK